MNTSTESTSVTRKKSSLAVFLKFGRRNQQSYVTTHMSVRKFRRRLFIFDPSEMCLCGLLTIENSVDLVACIEIFFSLVLLIQAPDLITMDGTYFYFLGRFDGTGQSFFALHVITCVSCLISTLLLYIGSRKRIPVLLLPHLLWQIGFVILSVATITILMTLGMYGKMLLPASIVLSVMMFFAGSFEVWWALLSYAHYDSLCAKSSLHRSLSSESFNDCVV